MRNVRILKSSNKAFRRGGLRRSRGGVGKGNWQITLLVVFCLLGLISLVLMVYKLSVKKFKNWRSILIYSASMLIVTLCFCIPAIVFLCLSTSATVDILALISLCCLIAPILILIPIALTKSRHFEGNNGESKIMKGNAEVYTAKDNDGDGGPFPAYNFLPQASTETYSTGVSVDPKDQTSQQSKPPASV